MPAPHRDAEYRLAEAAELAVAEAAEQDTLLEFLRAVDVKAVRHDLELRRARLADEVALRYGVRLHPHPRRSDVAVLSRSDYAALADAVMHDPYIDALGRGYYLGLGGELVLQSAPDWACDPDAIVQARALAALRISSRSVMQPVTRFAEVIASVGKRA